MIPTGAVQVVGQPPALAHDSTAPSTLALDLALALSDAGVGVFGQTVFVNHLPAAPDTALAVIEYAGVRRVALADESHIDAWAQVLCRTSTQSAMDAFVASARAALAAMHESHGTAYGLVQPEAPRSLGRDRRRRLVYAVRVFVERLS